MLRVDRTPLSQVRRWLVASRIHVEVSGVFELLFRVLWRRGTRGGGGAEGRANSLGHLEHLVFAPALQPVSLTALSGHSWRALGSALDG